MICISFKKFIQENGVSNIKVIFCDISMGLYHFIYLKSSIKILYIPQYPDVEEWLT